LLLRIFDPSAGEILIDGKNLNGLNLKKWKDQIGYVPQDVFLFSDTIENNIAFGAQASDPQLNEKIKLAVQQASLEDAITGFKDGLKTRVGERGITLSGGQKQRVAIARAFIKNPSLLILDDCLSALDTQTESDILEKLQQLKKGKTSLIISHRVSSVKDADRILVLHSGKIIEEGTHEDLMKLNGSYSEIYHKQILEQKD
jgi:ATP-binding cassette subfamily B protein